MDYKNFFINEQRTNPRRFYQGGDIIVGNIKGDDEDIWWGYAREEDGTPIAMIDKFRNWLIEIGADLNNTNEVLVFSLIYSEMNNRFKINDLKTYFDIIIQESTYYTLTYKEAVILKEKIKLLRKHFNMKNPLSFNNP